MRSEVSLNLPAKCGTKCQQRKRQIWELASTKFASSDKEEQNDNSARPKKEKQTNGAGFITETTQKARAKTTTTAAKAGQASTTAMNVVRTDTRTTANKTHGEMANPVEIIKAGSNATHATTEIIGQFQPEKKKSR